MVLSTNGEVVPVVFVKVPPEVSELCHCTKPVLPVKLITGAVVLEHIVAVPEAIAAVPVTVARSTFTVAVIVAAAQTPFVTTAL